MGNKKSGTALVAASCRLIEQYQPNRLFSDPIIKEFFNKPVRLLMQFRSIRNWVIGKCDSRTRGIYGLFVCRTRYIDDALQAAVVKGIQQVVILGAGLDTRPYRILGIEAIRVFEVDLPSTQDSKKEKLQRTFGSIPKGVSFIPIDFNIQKLSEVLTSKGFNFAKPAFFIWEGVTQYISQDAVTNTLTSISETAPGSEIVFTYILKSVIEKESDIEGANDFVNYINKSKNRFKEHYETWRFGLEPSQLEVLLRPFNLMLVEDVGASYYQEKYLEPIGRSLDVSEIERIAYARVI
jgi:methyltransferase (TIGR00027 family)